MSQNINPETGIRFGVICPSDVENWYDWSSAVVDDKCPYCQGTNVNLTDEVNGCYTCEGCKATFMEDESEDFTEVGREYITERYKAIQLVEGENIVVEKSPYFTYSRLCSPCYPNAGDLASGIAIVVDESSGYKTYCFGHTWYENGIAPFPIYRVSDGTLRWRGPRKKKKKSGLILTPRKRSISLDF